MDMNGYKHEAEALAAVRSETLMQAAEHVPSHWHVAPGLQVRCSCGWKTEATAADCRRDDHQDEINEANDKAWQQHIRSLAPDPNYRKRVETGAAIAEALRVKPLADRIVAELDSAKVKWADHGYVWLDAAKIIVWRAFLGDKFNTEETPERVADLQRTLKRLERA
jgi:hypothetical protein